MAKQNQRRKGLVVVNTGDGKGKTTAALGVLLRAWGRDMRVVMIQFIKTTTANFGEQRAARKMQVEMVSMGKGFTWLSKNINEDKAVAQQCWEICKQKLQSKEYDIVILDEITYVMNYNWIPVSEVLQALRDRPQETHVILTGRNAPDQLMDFADLVTEMVEVKHPFKRGIKAQKGLEF